MEGRFAFGPVFFRQARYGFTVNPIALCDLGVRGVALYCKLGDPQVSRRPVICSVPIKRQQVMFQIHPLSANILFSVGSIKIIKDSAEIK